MLKKLDSVLVDDCQLEKGEKPLVVGVSGGPDSLCLLHSLRQLGYPLIAAHLDHSLRTESAADAGFVTQFAQQLDIQVIVEQADVSAIAQANHQSVEEAARFVRYRFLFRVAAEHTAAAVAVGHTADDQAETTLMHILRGTGLPGLRSMGFRSLPNAWSTTIPLVRPLLGIWRSQVLAYLEENNLSALDDLSNADLRFYRNRLRHEVLPYLETIHPGVRRRLWQTADLLRDEDEVVEGIISQAWDSLCLEAGQGFIALSAVQVRSQPKAVQRRVLRRAIAGLRPGLRDIDYAAIERALAFLHHPPASRRSDLVAGLDLFLEGNALRVVDRLARLSQPDWHQIPTGSELTLVVPGETDLPGDGRLTAQILPASAELFAQAISNLDPYTAWLDLAKLTLPLSVRTRHPGDRFRPLGMEGHSLKLSDFMINHAIPRPARDGWPLMISGGEIAWIPGYRIGAAFAINASTRSILRLRLF